MTIGKLPATGPSSSTQKSQELPRESRAGFQKIKPAPERVPLKPFPSKSNASPQPSPAPSNRADPSKMQSEGAGTSTKRFWEKQDVASAKKAPSQSTDSQPKPSPAPTKSPPPQSNLFGKAPAAQSKPAGQSGPRASDATKPAPRQTSTFTSTNPSSHTGASTGNSTQAARDFWTRQATPAPGKPSSSTPQPPLASTKHSGSAPSKPAGQGVQGPSVHLSHSMAATASLARFQKDMAEWCSSDTAILSHEYVSTITADHIRLLPKGTTEIYLNRVVLTRDAVQALQERPIKFLSLNSTSGLQPHDEPIVLPRSLRSLVMIGDMLPTKALLAAAGAHPELQSVRAISVQASDADAINLARSGSLNTIELPYNHLTAKGANALLGMPTLEILDLSENRIGSNHSQLSSSQIPLSSRLSRLDVSDNRDLSNVSLQALYRLPLNALNLSGTKVSEFPRDNRNPGSDSTMLLGLDGTRFIEQPAIGSSPWQGMRTLWLGDTRMSFYTQDAYEAWQRVLFGSALSEIALPRADMGAYLEDLSLQPSLEMVDISGSSIPSGQLHALTGEHLPSVLVLSDCDLTSAHVDELTQRPYPDPRLRQLWIDENTNLDDRDYARLLARYPNAVLGIGDDEHAAACFDRLPRPLQDRVRKSAWDRDFPLHPEQAS